MKYLCVECLWAQVPAARARRCIADKDLDNTDNNRGLCHGRMGTRYRWAVSATSDASNSGFVGRYSFGREQYA